MKNRNVYEFTGNIEKSVKDGDIRNIITFDYTQSFIDKVLATFENKKIIEPSETFPFEQILIKTRSPWRIGPIQIREVKLKDILVKNTSFDRDKFIEAIKLIAKTFKNTINGIVIPSHCSFSNDIIQILHDNVRDTKVVIIN